MALIHTCYRITDIDRSVAFYKALGFEEVGRIPISDEAVNVFMNQPGDGNMPRLELTYNFGVDSYEIGTGYGHIAITAEHLDDARQARQAGHRAGEAAVLDPRGRLAAVLRQRPRWVSDRADRDELNPLRISVTVRYLTTASSEFEVDAIRGRLSQAGIQMLAQDP